MWLRQRSRTLETWFIFFDQSHKPCMTLGKSIICSVSSFFSKNWGQEFFCFFHFTLFLHTDGHLCKSFCIDWYSKDLTSVVPLSVSKVQNKKKKFFYVFRICFYMNNEQWPSSLLFKFGLGISSLFFIIIIFNTYLAMVLSLRKYLRKWFYKHDLWKWTVHVCRWEIVCMDQSNSSSFAEAKAC